MLNISPVLLREEIGRRLRAARRKARLTITEAAADLDLSNASLSRIETGQQMPSVHLVRSMMDRYDIREDELVDKVRAARKPGWWKAYGVSDRDFIAMETGVSRMHAFTPQVVHGLLQTAEYAQAIFRSSRQVRSEEWITNQLNVRLIRQDRLTDEAFPLNLVTVVDEQALRRPVGGPQVMQAQLRHLALIAELPTVTLQVLPNTVVLNEAMKGAFTMVDFPDKNQPPMVFVETALGADRKDKAEVVYTARLQFEHLRSLALGPDESVVLIEQVADELWSS